MKRTKTNGKLLNTLLEAHHGFRGLCKNCICKWKAVLQPSLNHKWKIGHISPSLQWYYSIIPVAGFVPSVELGFFLLDLLKNKFRVQHESHIEEFFAPNKEQLHTKNILFWKKNNNNKPRCHTSWIEKRLKSSSSNIYTCIPTDLLYQK